MAFSWPTDNELASVQDKSKYDSVDIGTRTKIGEKSLLLTGGYGYPYPISAYPYIYIEIWRFPSSGGTPVQVGNGKIYKRNGDDDDCGLDALYGSKDLADVRTRKRSKLLTRELALTQYGKFYSYWNFSKDFDFAWPYSTDAYPYIKLNGKYYKRLNDNDIGGLTSNSSNLDKCALCRLVKDAFLTENESLPLIEDNLNEYSLSGLIPQRSERIQNPDLMDAWDEEDKYTYKSKWFRWTKQGDERVYNQLLDIYKYTVPKGYRTNDNFVRAVTIGDPYGSITASLSPNANAGFYYRNKDNGTDSVSNDWYKQKFPIDNSSWDSEGKKGYNSPKHFAIVGGFAPLENVIPLDENNADKIVKISVDGDDTVFSYGGEEYRRIKTDLISKIYVLQRFADRDWYNKLWARKNIEQRRFSGTDRDISNGNLIKVERTPYFHGKTFGSFFNYDAVIKNSNGTEVTTLAPKTVYNKVYTIIADYPEFDRYESGPLWFCHYPSSAEYPYSFEMPGFKSGVSIETTRNADFELQLKNYCLELNIDSRYFFREIPLSQNFIFKNESSDSNNLNANYIKNSDSLWYQINSQFAPVPFSVGNIYPYDIIKCNQEEFLAPDDRYAKFKTKTGDTFLMGNGIVDSRKDYSGKWCTTSININDSVGIFTGTVMVPKEKISNVNSLFSPTSPYCKLTAYDMSGLGNQHCFIDFWSQIKNFNYNILPVRGFLPLTEPEDVNKIVFNSEYADGDQVGIFHSYLNKYGADNNFAGLSRGFYISGNDNYWSDRSIHDYEVPAVAAFNDTSNKYPVAEEKVLDYSKAKTNDYLASLTPANPIGVYVLYK